MTLVELMIVLAIMAIVAGTIFSVFLTSLHAYWKGNVSTQVQQGARVALDRLTRDLREARFLYTGTQGGFAFNIGGPGCAQAAPQISFAFPHFGTMTLSDNVTTIYATDPNSSGQMPYTGSYVSYYLAASAGSTTPNTSGPYLEKTIYDTNALTLTTITVANNITSLAVQAGTACPTTTSRELTATVTASSNPLGGTNPSGNANVPTSTAVVTMDIALRNQ
jgi:prepilin-type N-terminal cleavage/methylation domain-containing protein